MMKHFIIFFTLCILTRHSVLAQKDATTNSINGHEFVDLNLPSGNLWATMNIGARSEFEPGNLFAWGETCPKSAYSWNNYKYAKGNSSKLTKYCYDSARFGNNGYADTLNILEPKDDAATANWGLPWHMPTQEDFRELAECCNWTWTNSYKNSGTEGFIVSSTNGNAIFLPSACKYNPDDPSSGKYGGYWSCVLSQEKYPSHAYELNFEECPDVDARLSRCCGNSIRAVFSPNNSAPRFKKKTKKELTDKQIAEINKSDKSTPIEILGLKPKLWGNIDGFCHKMTEQGFVRDIYMEESDNRRFFYGTYFGDSCHIVVDYDINTTFVFCVEISLRLKGKEKGLRVLEKLRRIMENKYGVFESEDISLARRHIEGGLIVSKYEYNHYDSQSIIWLSFINKENTPTEDLELFKKVYGL